MPFSVVNVFPASPILVMDLRPSPPFIVMDELMVILVVIMVVGECLRADRKKAPLR